MNFHIWKRYIPLVPLSLLTLHPSTMSKYYTAVIFDLGDILITWPPSASTFLPAKTFKSIIRSAHWLEYEKGNNTEDKAYSLVAQEFNVSFIDVKNSFEEARKSLHWQSNSRILEVIRELKESGLAIYTMSNVSGPDWQSISAACTPEQWAFFNRTFIS